MRIVIVLAAALLTVSCVSTPGSFVELRSSTASPAAQASSPKDVIATLSTLYAIRNAEARQAFKVELTGRLARCGVNVHFLSETKGASRVFSSDLLDDGRNAAEVPRDHLLTIRETSSEVGGGLTTSYLDVALRNAANGKEVWRTSATVKRTLLITNGMTEFGSVLVDRMISDRVLKSCH